MLVSPDNLASKLHDGLKPLYLIYGEETLTKLEAADAIRAAARKAGYSEREHFVVEAHFDWSLVTQSSDNLSLFATQRIVEITINTAKPSVDAAEFLAGIAADPPPNTLFIVILQKLDRAATDSAWFAACDRTGVTIAAPLVERDALPRWVKARLTAIGFDASREVIELTDEGAHRGYRNALIQEGDAPLTEPKYLLGYTSWEHEVGHHDPITDIYHCGLLLASLTFGLDLTDPEDLSTFVGHLVDYIVLDARTSRGRERIDCLAKTLVSAKPSQET